MSEIKKIPITGQAATSASDVSSTQHLRVKVFRGAQNLPLYVADELGLFKKHGIDVELLFTANSVVLRDGLAAGDFHLTHTAADNALAMKDVAGINVVIVMGGDSGLNELFAQPAFSSLQSLKGQALAVDAPDTAYALQAKEILRRAGLRAGIDYRVIPIGGTFQRIKALQEDPALAASILNPPFSEEARDAGLISFGRAVDLLGPYQATAAFGLRSWIESSPSLIIQYIAAYISAVRYVLDPANAETAKEILARKLGISNQTAQVTYQALIEPGFGLDPDAALNPTALQNVLKIRIEHEGGVQNSADEVASYFDLRYYEQALHILRAA